MLAYKFRSLEQLHYVLDIIFNNRLYCAAWSELNDPLETLWAHSYSPTESEPHCNKIVTEINKKLHNYRICSLSGTFESSLLWGHYASGFRGFAIAIELPNDCENIKKVAYNRYTFAGGNIDHSTTTDDYCERIIFSKNREWKYEKEVRIVQKDTWFQLPDKAIKRIILGHKVDVAVFQMFKIICKQRTIDLRTLGIGDEGLDEDYVSLE